MGSQYIYMYIEALFRTVLHPNSCRLQWYIIQPIQSHTISFNAAK